MNYNALQENMPRGTFQFPVAYYYVDCHHPRYQMIPHWHTEYELIHICSGEFSLTLDGNSFLLKNGDCAMIQSGVLHSGIPKDCIYECCVLELERFLNNQMTCGKELLNLLHSGSPIQVPFPDGGEPARLTADFFSVLRQSGPGREAILTGQLWQLCGLIQRYALYTRPDGNILRNRRHTERIKEVLQLIRQDYSRTLTLEEMAAAADMSPKYFCRVFRQITGHTPIDYLNTYRMELAAEMLKDPTITVTEAALSCGYDDLSYFSRIFRKYWGKTPTAFRSPSSDRSD